MTAALIVAFLIVGMFGLALVLAALLDELAARHRGHADVAVTDLERRIRGRR